MGHWGDGVGGAEVVVRDIRYKFVENRVLLVSLLKKIFLLLNIILIVFHCFSQIYFITVFTQTHFPI